MFSQLLILINQTIRRRIVGRYVIIITQLREYLICKLFAEFYAPLVKAEDIPDNTLNKNLVFIHRYKASKGTWSNLLYQY